MIADNLRSTRPAVKENVSYYQTITEYYWAEMICIRRYIRQQHNTAASFGRSVEKQSVEYIYIYVC